MKNMDGRYVCTLSSGYMDGLHTKYMGVYIHFLLLNYTTTKLLHTYPYSPTTQHSIVNRCHLFDRDRQGNATRFPLLLADPSANQSVVVIVISDWFLFLLFL